MHVCFEQLLGSIVLLVGRNAFGKILLHYAIVCISVEESCTCFLFHGAECLCCFSSTLHIQCVCALNNYLALQSASWEGMFWKDSTALCKHCSSLCRLCSDKVVFFFKSRELTEGDVIVSIVLTKN